jgi:NAD(P)-dependent dehydrogenase (short-subunit alcohol dehydrogenase family)
MNKNRAEFAHALRQGKTVWAAGVYDALSAKLAEAAGFPALMTSGFAISASLLGQPDVEVYTMTENLSVARHVSNAVSIPVVADTDTGYGNAINVMRGAEALSTYEPISELEKFRIEYWDLEEAKLRRMPKPKALAGQIALVTGGASGIGRAIVQRYFDEGACVAIADRDLEGAKSLIEQMGGSERLLAVGVDVTLEDQVSAAVAATTLAFGGIDILVNNAGLSLSKSLVDTTVSDWDLQHNVMARGSFLFSREVAKAMIVQKMAGNILYIASKNAVFAGPNNVAYGATKADQAHQVRLLAAELGEYGIRVNGINPDGVVQGSGIFASGWGANRAAVSGVEEEKLGAFYAQRSILKLEVLPSHIAAAAFAFVAGDLPLTTGSHIPVDSGVASAFLR